VIRRFVESERPIIRSQALHALGALGSLDEVPLLEQGLDDVDRWAAANAARGLLSIGGTTLLDRVSTLRPEHAVLLKQVALEVDA
jgi:HEAT repeat protein